jgi:S-layer family protein
MNASILRGIRLSVMLAISAAPVAAQMRPNTYGTTNVTYYRVGSTEFKAYSNSDSYFDSGNWLWPGGGVPGASTGLFYATPHLPSGAVLTYLELDYCDTNTAALHIRLGFEECDPILGSGCAGPELGYVVSVGQPIDAPCASVSVALNHTVDNATEVLVLDLTFGAFDETNILRSVVIGYKLQVSPAPPTATFNDVPTSHPLFQFIEALAASGITAGCGDGNYCPDDPLTRGQVAVFLAKALGLNWPQ